MIFMPDTGRWFVFPKNEVAVNDADAFREIHRIGSGFTNSARYREFADATPKHVYYDRPQATCGATKAFARAFSKTFLRQHWEKLVKAKASLAASRINDEAMREGKVDAMKWCIFFGNGRITHLMFGESFGALEMAR